MTESNSNRGSIGIIGGAGPEAGALFFQEIVESFQKDYGFQFDYEFPEIVLYSFPFADMLSANSQDNRLLLSQQLKHAIEKLESWNLENIAIGCNTLHCFLEEKKPTKQSNFFHLSEETVQEFAKMSQTTALVLCSNTTKKLNLYNFPHFKYPDEKDQERINEIILETLSGKNLDALSHSLIEFIETRCNKNEVAILACTELSVLRRRAPQAFQNLKYLDPMEIVAKEISRSSIKKRSIK